MIILEITDECDLECPMCIADSKRGKGNFRSLSALVERVDNYLQASAPIQLLMISGGEPTLHHECLQILAALASRCGQLMLITNGVRIATDQSFVKNLAEVIDCNRNIEIYLQFDSENPEVLRELRGYDFTGVRRAAIANLKAVGIQATLVCVVKRGLNHEEVGAIVLTAISHDNIRGVTFQPISAAGRHGSYNFEEHRTTLTEVRSTILRHLNLSSASLYPHPLNPEQICIGYFEKQGKRIVPVTNHSDYPELHTTLYFPGERLSDINNLFRLTIISFLDRFTWTSVQSGRGGIVFLTDSGRTIGLDKHFKL